MTRRPSAARVAAAATTSPIVAGLERVWAAIAARHPELPATVAISLGAGTVGKVTKLGHFAEGRWTAGTDAAEVHEVFIAAEFLDNPTSVLTTLLHEAAHALAHVRGIKDTSRNGRYHNTRYRLVAAELGLDAEDVGTIGFSATTMTQSTVESYAAELAVLADLGALRRSERNGNGRKSSNNGVSLSCDCQRKIRVSRKVADLGPITCGICESDFIEQ